MCSATGVSPCTSQDLLSSRYDTSRPALEMADENAALNGHEIEWVEANAFDLLKDYSTAGAAV